MSFKYLRQTEVGGGAAYGFITTMSSCPTQHLQGISPNSPDSPDLHRSINSGHNGILKLEMQPVIKT